MAGDVDVDIDELRAHLEGKNRWVLSTTRKDGRPQMSLVTGGMTEDGKLAVATYPMRAKTKNAKANPNVSVLVMGEQFNSEWVQIGRHRRGVRHAQPGGLGQPWSSTSAASAASTTTGTSTARPWLTRGKSAIMITPTRWSPVSKGGFPPELFED